MATVANYNKTTTVSQLLDELHVALHFVEMNVRAYLVSPGVVQIDLKKIDKKFRAYAEKYPIITMLDVYTDVRNQLDEVIWYKDQLLANGTYYDELEKLAKMSSSSQCQLQYIS